MSIVPAARARQPGPPVAFPSGAAVRWLPVMGVVAASAVVALAARLGDLPVLALAATSAAVVAVSFRWPLIPLFLFAAVIPVDEIVRLGPLGSVGRIAAILFVVAYALPRLTRIRWRGMPVAAWAYLGWAILSVVWALDQNVAIAELGTLVQLFAMGLLTADVVIQRPRVVRPLLWVYTASASVTAVIGVRAYLQGAAVDGDRFAALPGQDPAQYAAILLPALVFAAFELFHGRNVVPAAFATGVTTLAILLSGTRGAWVSIAVVVAFLVLPRLTRRRRLIALAVGGLVFVAALQVPGVGDLVSRRADLALSTGGSGRTTIWAVGLEIFDSSPIAGVGFANFPVAFTPSRIEAAFVSADPGVGRAPHNLIIGTLGELGIIGFLLLALFLGPLTFRPGWGPDAVVVQAMLASLLTAAMFLDVLSNRKQVWLIVGIAAGLAYLRDRRPAAAPGDPVSP